MTPAEALLNLNIVARVLNKILGGLSVAEAMREYAEEEGVDTVIAYEIVSETLESALDRS